VKTYYEIVKSEEPTAVALGCFDGIHLGHRAVLDAVIAMKDRGFCPTVLTYGTAERMIPSVKNVPELMSPRMKIKLLAESSVERLIVAELEPMRRFSPEEFVKKILRDALNAKFVCCGFNYRFGENGVGDANTLRGLCEKIGIEVKVIDNVEIDGSTVSSTAIRKAVAEGDMQTAQKLLGRPFAIDFTVVHGRELGRKIGTPTVNQEFPDGFILPRFGVYASYAVIDGVRYPAITNAGVKPTVTAERPLAETFIYGFSGDLYGKNIEVYFLEYLRQEKRFDSIDELKKQIENDVIKAQKVLENRK
jgi:riboflavin kinase/FMN adenylyltransferase